MLTIGTAPKISLNVCVTESSMSTYGKMQSPYPSNDPQYVLNGIRISEETDREAVWAAVQAGCRAAAACSGDHGEAMRTAAQLMSPTAPEFDQGVAAGIALTLLALSAR